MISQLQVLCKVLSTKDMSLITLNNLTEDFFFNYKDEFNYIQNHYNTYRTVPDKLTFLGVFPDFDYVEVAEPDSFLIEQLTKDYNVNFLVKKFNHMRQLLESDKATEAMNEYIDDTMNKPHLVGTALSSVNILSDTSRYDHYVERCSDRSKYYISTGFGELDAQIGGIDRENEDMVIAARTGIGKTWTLIKMAVAASNQGLRVGIYSGEMSVDKVGYRIDTFLGRGLIKNSDITRGNAVAQAQYKQYIDSLAGSKNGPIIVTTPNMINGPATVDALRTFVEKEKLDILFIDQYSLLEDSSHAKASFERVANISKAIKNLQVMKRIPIISVSQMNRSKNEDDTQDTTQIGLSDRIGQDATSIIMLSRKQDKENGDDQLILNIVKSRDGGDNKQLTYRCDFNTGRLDFIEDETDASRYEQSNAVDELPETDEAPF